ncbi:flagellar basal-body MS-ring/collar protein FliF [Anaerobiospirillum thomasii]|uniref:Flagellar M-ring protein n=1 Tax=Anaerobiospirillum thomasii TaxID=179995 RepID=A0A2X0VCY3_9GAMM|nr:flagellar basal-body MS-ring/collar protein FliF [Anaerobiospirillum thomasii]SPT70755.1 Flagellar M-ring protein [Anaerobiospirillum thomasii]
MADNEYPLTQGQNTAGAQALPMDPNTQAEPQQQQAQNSEPEVFIDPVPQSDPHLDSTSGETGPRSFSDKAKDFIHHGEVLRKFIIFGFLVLFIAGAIFGLVSIQSSQSDSAYRQLGQYTPSQIGSVLDFLDTEGYQYQLRANNTIDVLADDYSKVSEMLLRRGIALPKEKTDDGNSIIMSDSGFGVSQRLEGERIKHGREVQLARAIERIEGVDHATVLLAIPKENVFAREKQRPSAAVVVTLKNGAYLSPENVNSIRFMVASSVHNLLAKDVSVTDHTGRLLSAMNASSGADNKLQREFEMRTMREAQYRSKLETILTPMLGYGNYSAEVDVTLDTTLEEETRQMYNPDNQAVRSETLREEKGADEVVNPYGVPGSLSNQPPANAAIPQQLKDGTANAANSSKDSKESREAVRNYEVDTTIRHTTRPTNVVSRLTVSVAVDYVRNVSPEGAVSYAPRSQEDLNKIADLVRGGLGLDERRGDVVHVETVSFPHADEMPALPWWQQESFYRIARIAGAVIVILILILFVIRPMIQKLLSNKKEENLDLDYSEMDDEPALEGNDDLNLIAAGRELSDRVYSINREGSIVLPNLHKDEDLLKAVRTLVSNEPELSSEVVREWLNSDISEKENNK